MLENISDLITNKLVISVILVTLLLISRNTIIRKIRKGSDFLSEDQRLWISRTKNISVLLIGLMLVFIWMPELREFALSIAAIAVAIVLAAKELILCLSGAVLRTGSGAFSIGDWVEIGELRGEVIDQNMLSTTIQELDTERNNYDYTGKTVTIPNSLFLTQSVKNMNFMKRYVFHHFTVTTEQPMESAKLREFINTQATEYCAEFHEIAERYNAIIEKRAGVDIPDATPRLRISTSDSGKFNYTIIIFCPTKRAIEIEQKLTDDIISFYQNHQTSTC